MLFYRPPCLGTVTWHSRASQFLSAGADNSQHVDHHRISSRHLWFRQRQSCL